MIELSIVTTLYKSAPYMRKCIDSLLQQDISPSRYEIILVNDGSPDNSKEIADEYAAKYSNIRVFSHENIGLAGARNTGLQNARGEYICFVDPDDYILENSFAALLAQMRSENLDVLRFNYQMVDENYNIVIKPENAANIDYSACVMSGKDFLLKRLEFACFVWSYIFRTAVIRENHIQFIQGDYFDDTMWLPQVISAADRINSTDFCRYYYLQRQGSLVYTVTSEDTIRKVEGQMVLVKKLYERSLEVDSQSAVWYQAMYSKSVLSLLSSVAVQSYSEAKKYISRLKDIHVFPLSTYFLTKSQQSKVKLINFSPMLFCWLLNLKNR